MATKKPARKTLVAGRVEQEYQRYRIVAGKVGATCKAIAYLGMEGIGAVESVEASSVDEAVSLMKERLETRRSSMRLERTNGVPTAAEFRESLAALPASIREGIRVLQIERLDPFATSSTLATLALRTRSDVHTIVEDLRKAARRLDELLGARAGETAAGSDPLCLLATVDGNDAAGVPVMRFHDQIREALAMLPAERPVTLVRRR